MVYKSVCTKPLLSAKQRQKRVDFALAYKDFRWRSVIFTDSKYFVYQHSTRSGAKRAWVTIGDKPVRQAAKNK